MGWVGLGCNALQGTTNAAFDDAVHCLLRQGKTLANNVHKAARDAMMKPACEKIQVAKYLYA